ncbi:MAG: hypothetical protein AB7R89_02275 [Dehalococcoidia bacterium]
MADQINHESLAEQIDQFLTYVATAWETVPDDAAEWATWDEESQLIYRLEWAIPRDRWNDLQHWVARGLLTHEQQCRFHEIEELMRTHSATLARLFGSTDPEQPFQVSANGIVGH